MKLYFNANFELVKETGTDCYKGSSGYDELYVLLASDGYSKLANNGGSIYPTYAAQLPNGLVTPEVASWSLASGEETTDGVTYTYWGTTFIDRVLSIEGQVQLTINFKINNGTTIKTLRSGKAILNVVDTVVSDNNVLWTDSDSGAFNDFNDIIQGYSNSLSQKANLTGNSTVNFNAATMTAEELKANIARLNYSYLQSVYTKDGSAHAFDLLYDSTNAKGYIQQCVDVLPVYDFEDGDSTKWFDIGAENKRFHDIFATAINLEHIAGKDKHWYITLSGDKLYLLKSVIPGMSNNVVQDIDFGSSDRPLNSVHSKTFIAYGNVMPDVTKSRDIGSSDVVFNSVYASYHKAWMIDRLNPDSNGNLFLASTIKPAEASYRHNSETVDLGTSSNPFDNGYFSNLSVANVSSKPLFNNGALFNNSSTFYKIHVIDEAYFTTSPTVSQNTTDDTSVINYGAIKEYVQAEFKKATNHIQFGDSTLDSATGKITIPYTLGGVSHSFIIDTNSEGMIKSQKLMKDDNGYYIHITYYNGDTDDTLRLDTLTDVYTSGSASTDDVVINVSEGKITATLSTTLKTMANNEGVRVANEKVRIANYNTFINALANQQGTLCVCDVDDDGNLVLTKVNATLDTDGIQNQTE